MIASLAFVLFFLQVKHYLVDFVLQTDEEIQHKGIYLDWKGLQHSVKHGVGTFLVLWTVTGWENIEFAVILGFLDLVLHYDIDWIKANYGNTNQNTKEFWNHLGLDQLAHQLVYIAIGVLTVV